MYPTWVASIHVCITICPTPCADPTLTINNLRLVMASVKNWYDLGGYFGGLGVPTAVRDEIGYSTAYQTEEEKKEALLLYYLRTMPMASWQSVAGALHYREDVTALQAVKAFLKYTPAGQLILQGTYSTCQKTSERYPTTTLALPCYSTLLPCCYPTTLLCYLSTLLPYRATLLPFHATLYSSR